MHGSTRAFNEAYRRRVKELREASGMTQAEAAEALGITMESYKKYESRSPLPPHLLPRFASIVRRDIAFILTGKSESRRRGPRGGANKQINENRPDAGI